MIIVAEKDAAAFLVDMLGDHRIELKTLAAKYEDSMAVTLEHVINHGLKELLKDPYKQG